jgi:hypothetical protein
MAGPFRVETCPDALKVRYLLTPARLEKMIFMVIFSSIVGTVFLGALGFLFQKDVEGTRSIGYVVCAGSGLMLFPTLLTLVDNVRPRAYVFDKTRGGLFKRNKRLCSLDDISRVEVNREEDSDHTYYSGRVLCGEREVWRFDSDHFSCITATESQKREVYLVAGEVSRFLGLAPPAEDS